MSQGGNPRLLAAAGALLMCLASTSAQADPTPTTLPWSGGFFRLTTEQQKFQTTFNHLFNGGALFGVTLSGPLNDSSREAALTSADRLAPGFSTELSLGYDSRFNWLSSIDRDTAVDFQRINEQLTSCPREDHDGIRALLNEVGASADLSRKSLVAAVASRVADGRLAGADRAAICHQLAEHGRRTAPATNEQLRAMARDADRAEFQRTGLLSGAGGSPYAIYIGGDLRASYDRVTAYRGDLAGRPTGEDQFAAELGIRFRMTWTSALFSLAAGGAYARSVDARRVERCVSEMSSNPAVTGRSCDANVRVFNGDPSEGASAYARAGFAYIFRRDFAANWRPGIELQANFNSLGRANVVGGRLLGFLSPTTGPALTRFGIGLDVSRDLGSETPTTTVVPFLMVGASLNPR